MTAGKLGLLADVRGNVPALAQALEVLREERCARVACLGSTAEGGDGDAEALSLLRGAGAIILPSPHDVAEIAELPAEVASEGLVLAHATPPEIPQLEVSWLTGGGVPHPLEACSWLSESGQSRACGDLYAPLVYFGGLPRRRVFLWSQAVTMPPGPFLACPGSALLSGRDGSSVMTWDESERTLTVVRYSRDGARLARRRVVVLVYCADFEPFMPDEAALTDVDLLVKTDADEIVRDVEESKPDFVLLDYHLTGRSSGLDAVIALRKGRDRLPAPVFTIAGNPADNEGMKSAGALGGLPYTYLKDVLSRLLGEITGG